MIRFLKIAIVLLLIESVAALVLGLMLFEKRELLKGRTFKLEDALTRLASTIEAEPPARLPRPDYPARDIAETTPTILADPPRSSFWNTYPSEMEQSAAVQLDIGPRRAQLAAYYRPDPLTLKPMRDEITGERLTTGPGSMQELLDEVVRKAAVQWNRLNETRFQLQNTRQELVAVIEELNDKKRGLRVALNTIVQRDGAIAGLRDTIQSRDATILECRGQITRIQDDNAEQQRVIERQKDELDEDKIEIARLARDLKDALSGGGPRNVERSWRYWSPGAKGTVTDVDENWRFVVLELSEDFAAQYRRARERSRDAPEPDLMIMRRTDGRDEFVTKVKLTRFNADDRIGVAHILSSWQQTDVRRGDSVLY